MQPSNLLKIESLDKGWCDKDHVLLHACFQLLTDFVEKEMPKYPHINWNVPVNNRNFVIKEIAFNADNAEGTDAAGTRDMRKEFGELYNWWQKWKKKKAANRKSSFEEDHADYLKENEMLKKLIDVRMYMWT